MCRDLSEDHSDTRQPDHATQAHSQAAEGDGAGAAPLANCRVMKTRPIAIGTGLTLVIGALVWLDVLPGRWRIQRLFYSQLELDVARRARHRAARLARFAREDIEDGGVLLLGSSTIERFPDVELLPGARSINRGIGNEDLGKLAERTPRTLQRVRPRHVVLYAGSVDARRPGDDGDWRPVDSLLRGVASLVQTIQSRSESPELSLLGILPETEPRARFEARRRRINDALNGLAAAREGVSYIAVDRSDLVVRDSRTGHTLLRRALAADSIHLNARGYALLTETLREHLRELDARTSPPKKS